MIEMFAGVKKITREEELEAIHAVAKEDAHGVFAPTHIIVRENECLGHISLGSVPLVLCHFSLKKMEALDSFLVGNIIENLLANSGAKNMCMPIHESSPFHPFMTNKKLGYQNFGKMSFFVKEL